MQAKTSSVAALCVFYIQNGPLLQASVHGRRTCKREGGWPSNDRDNLLTTHEPLIVSSASSSSSSRSSAGGGGSKDGGAVAIQGVESVVVSVDCVSVHACARAYVRTYCPDLSHCRRGCVCAYMLGECVSVVRVL